MDEAPTPEPEKEVTPKKIKSKKIRILYAIVAILLIGAFAAGGWLYYDNAKTVRNQKIEISNLRKRLKDLGIRIPDLDEAPDAPIVTCNGGSDYSADIGRFDLTLSNPNVIIRTLDANFEGGPLTQLSIGRCIEGEMNVVDTYPTYEVKILGHPASDSAALRASFEAQWGSPLTAGGTVTIDGVTAHIYTGTGLFNTKLLYFDHNSIGYQIELTDTNATSEAILTDVISDWNFTP